MAEHPTSSPTSQNQYSQINIKLSPSGQLNYEGELNQESAEILEKLLQQAEYYRSKSKEAETERVEAKQQIDSITMVFVGCVLTLIVFMTYTVVSGITNFFTQQSVSTSYRTPEP